MTEPVWDYDGLIGKASVYFRRAREHPQADDGVFTLWFLLGLEFLLRAPLARVHPTLLADPTGDSILHAAGYGGTVEPKSVQLKAVLNRLHRIVPGFDDDRENDAKVLIGMRNRELHTSESLLSIDVAMWLPSFTRVADVICSHLTIDIHDLVGSEIVEHGRALVDTEDRRLAHAVQQRVASSRDLFMKLHQEEVTARRAQLPPPTDLLTYVTCPACGSDSVVQLAQIRTTNEHIEDDKIHYDVISIALGMRCYVCSLDLTGPAELKCAGIQQQFVTARYESFYDRFLDSYEPDDYGND